MVTCYTGASFNHKVCTGKFFYYYRITGECQKMPWWGQSKRWIKSWLQGIFNINRYIVPKTNSLRGAFVNCPHDVHWLIDNQFFSIKLWKIRKFRLIPRCGNFVEVHNFCRVCSDFPENLWKLCVSTKFPHEKISWNYGVLCSVRIHKFKRIF